MAVYITGDGLSLEGAWGFYCFLNTSSMTTTITVRFDGAGSGTSDMFGDWYDYIKITQKGVDTEYRTTSKTITLNVSDFAYLKSEDSGSPSYKFTVGQENSIGSSTDLVLGDVYLNGTKIDTYNTSININPSYTISIYPDENTFKPVISSMSDITIQSTSWNGLAVAGETILKVDNITCGNATSYDPNNRYYFYVDIYGTNGGTKTVTTLSTNSIKITDIVTPSSDTKSYTVTVMVIARNRYGGGASASKSITVYPYHLPRLKLNTTGDVSYVSRCQEDGTADGLGSWGHLHLVWDVCPINTTGSGTINTLQSATVILNNTTQLQPKGGSISAGYLDYIFPLATETQGNLTITLTDTRKSNTITALNVPKGSMPLSLYDDNSGIGVAFGCMATTSGMWVYMPMYLQSTSGSSMWRITVDDSGNLSTEKV